jgi:formamidopyrimidine-DNA glycosylase
MPELPEVQTVVNDLKTAGFIGADIANARVYWPKTVGEMEPKRFCREIEGCTIIDIRRRGKYIVLTLSGAKFLLIHLRMSGRVILSGQRQKRAKHEHVILTFADGRQLRFHDTRKFGRMYLLARPDRILGRLGPEPLGRYFTAARFFDLLSSRNRQLKPLLLDQTFVAGLGNIYVDEALWESRIHPLRRSGDLSRDEAQRLHRAIRKVLRLGILNAGTTFSPGSSGFASIQKKRGQNRKELMVFRRTGLPCPRCQTPIRRLIVGQRSTHVCEKCQAE